MKTLIFLILCILSIGLISAYSTNYLMDSSNNRYTSESSVSSFTRYINVTDSTILTNAFFNFTLNATKEKVEYYSGLQNTYYLSTTTRFAGQSFTIGTVCSSVDYEVDTIELNLTKTGLTGIVNLSIYTSNSSNLPGTLLVSNLTWNSSIVGSTYGLYNITIPKVNLSFGTQYILMLGTTQIANELRYSAVTTNQYNGGNVIDYVASTWQKPLVDLYFKTFGISNNLSLRVAIDTNIIDNNFSNNYQNKSINFANQINAYLQTCTSVNGSCYVPLSFYLSNTYTDEIIMEQNEDYDTYYYSSNTRFAGQSFTIGTSGSNSSFTLTKISSYFSRLSGLTGIVNVSVYTVNSSGLPDVLVSRNLTWNSSEVTTSYGIYSIDMPPTQLNQTKYILMFGTTETGNQLRYRVENVNVYSGGNLVDYNTRWNTLSSDMYFQVYGIPIGSVATNYASLFYSNLLFNDEGMTINDVGYTNLTYETSSEDFNINFTYSPISYPTSSAILNYNGTNYTASGSNGYYNVTIDIPLINSPNEAKLFYWIVSLTNSTGTFYYNTSTYSQSVNMINLSECISPTTIKALNFTAYDQTTLTRLTSWNFLATLNYFKGTGAISRNVSFNNQSILEKTICMLNNTEYKVSGAIQYSKTDYDPSEYNLNALVINNVTTNISLYLLNVSLTTTFIMQVLNQAQLPLQDYYIYVYRYTGYSTTPNLIQIAQTDADGKTIGYFETYTVDYKFIIKDTEGNTVYTSSKRKIIPESTPYTLTFIVGTPIPSPFSYYQNTTGMSYNPVLTFNKISKLVSLGYVDSSPDFNIAIMSVGYLNNSYSNDTLFCNITSTDQSGYLTCSLNESLSGSYYAEFFVIRNGTSTFIDRIVFNIKSIPEGITMLGLLGAFFILLIFGSAFMYNAIAGLISIDIGFIVVEMLGLTNIGWLGISGIIGVSVLIIIVLGRD